MPSQLVKPDQPPLEIPELLYQSPDAMRRLLACLLVFASAANVSPVLAQSDKPTCFFLECAPGDATVPPPAIDLPPNRPAPTPAALPRPAMAGEQCVRTAFGQVCTSSVLAPNKAITYGPANMFDDRLDTAWVEAVKGDGIGERILIEFDAPTPVAGVAMLNGYHKSNELFQRNARVAEIYLSASDGSAFETVLEDDPGLQARRFDRPLTLTWLVIEIAGSYPGTKYTDNAISELRVLFE